MSIKFNVFVQDMFMNAFAQLMKFRGFSEAERLSVLKAQKKIDAQVKVCQERFKELKSEFSGEELKQKVDELSACESELQPCLEYAIAAKAELSIQDLFFLLPVLLNLPKELE